MSADLFDVFEGGTAFTNSLAGASGATTDLISGGTANISRLTSVTDSQVLAAMTAGGLTPAKLSSTTSMFTSATGGISTLVSYGDRTISEAFDRFGTSNSYVGGLTGIGRPPSTCDLVNKAFGVMQQYGHEWMDAMNSALNTVNAKIQEMADLVAQGIAAGAAKIQALAAQVVGYVNTATAAVNKVIADITDGINAELAHIESMVKSCMNFCLTSAFGDFLKDPCAKGVIDKMGSPTLKGIIG